VVKTGVENGELKMFTDEYFMREALKEARKAFEKDEVPVGAVIVAGNRIIARAHNLTETLNDVTAHAEMQAITMAASFLGGKYLRECTLYVTLEPCLMCAGALYWAQIARIVYGAKDAKRGFSLNPSSPLHPATTLTTGILEKECAVLLTGFFKKKRK
jgi:tRNA(adenine34) deaminase